jgi:hypothetical protein
MAEPKTGRLTGKIPAARFNYRRALPYCVRIELESITLLNRDYEAIVTRHRSGRVVQGGRPHRSTYYVYCDDDIPPIEKLEAVYFDILDAGGAFARRLANPRIAEPIPFMEVERPRRPPDLTWLRQAASGADRRVPR